MGHLWETQDQQSVKYCKEPRSAFIPAREAYSERREDFRLVNNGCRIFAKVGLQLLALCYRAIGLLLWKLWTWHYGRNLTGSCIDAVVGVVPRLIRLVALRSAMGKTFAEMRLD
jgi:hypothetical protein